MTDAALPVAIGNGERLHPLYLLTGLARVARNAWGIIAGGAYLAVSDRMGFALILLAGFVIFSMASLLVRWLTFEFRLEEDQLKIEHGVLSRNSRSIPFDRVTDVDIEQGPIHRLFGLARVRLETGATAAARDSEGQLEAISLQRAQAIRDFVRARRGKRTASPPLTESGEEPAAAPMFAMDTRRVLIAGLFNFSLAVIAALFGASQTLGDAIGFDPFSRSFWLDMIASAGPLRAFVIAHQFVAAIAGTFLLLAVGIGTGLTRTILREHGFCLERTSGGYRRRRGLLTLTDVTIPERRIQASILATGPVRRAFGWFTLKFQSLAMDGKQGSHVVAPLARADEASVIQLSLGRPLTPRSDAWRPLPFSYFASGALIDVIAALIGLGLAILVSPFAIIAVAGLGLAAIAKWLEFRRSRYAIDRGHLFIDGGWWRQRLAVVPVGRIQSIDISESFWTRWFRFTRMRFGIAGGSMGSAFSIPAITRPAAESLREELAAG